GDELVGKHLLLLSDAVRAVHSLSLDGGVPPGIKDKVVVGFCQVKAQAPCFDGDKEHSEIGIPVKSLNLLLAVNAGSVEISVVNLRRLEEILDDAEVLYELAKHQHLVPFRKRVFQHMRNILELA